MRHRNCLSKAKEWMIYYLFAQKMTLGGRWGRMLNILDFVPMSKYICAVKDEGGERERERKRTSKQSSAVRPIWLVINGIKRRPAGWKP